MTCYRPWLAFIAAAAFAAAALFAVPLALEADRLLESSDDPAAIADRALGRHSTGRWRSAKSNWR
jgi:hypothetical protein